MKKLIPLFIIVIVVLLSVYIFFICDTSDGSNLLGDDPSVDVEISISEYRESIETTCDEITIVISVTNVGTIPLQYSDFTTGTYDFSVLVEDIDVWNSKRDMQVSDFGTLEAGDTKNITLTGGEYYDYLGSPSHDNYFRGPSNQNGTFKMKVSLNESYKENTYTSRGESDSVDLSMSIYEDPSINLLKSCEGIR